MPIARARLSCGNTSPIIPAASGAAAASLRYWIKQLLDKQRNKIVQKYFVLSYPAASAILKRTRCQYWVANAVPLIAKLKAKVATPSK